MTPAWPKTEKPLCAGSRRLAVQRLNTGEAGRGTLTGFKGLIGYYCGEVNSLWQAWGGLLFVAQDRAKNVKRINEAFLACKETHLLL